MIIKARKEGSQGQMDLEPLPVGVRDEDEDGHTRHPKARDIVTAIRMKLLNFENPIYDRSQTRYEELRSENGECISVTSTTPSTKDFSFHASGRRRAAAVNRGYQPLGGDARKTGLHNCKCGFVVAIAFICLITISVGVGLVIHFAVFRSADDHHPRPDWRPAPMPAHSAAPAGAFIRVTTVFQGSFHIVDGEYSQFSKALSDTSSAEYISLQSIFVHMMNDFFTKSALSSIYSKTNVLSIRRGSVWIQFEMLFADNIIVYPSHGTPSDGIPHHNDVIKVVHDACQQSTVDDQSLKCGRFIVAKTSIGLKPVNVRTISHKTSPVQPNSTKQDTIPTSTTTPTTEAPTTKQTEDKSSIKTTQKTTSTSMPITTSDKKDVVTVPVKNTSPPAPTETPISCGSGFFCASGVRTDVHKRSFCIDRLEVCDGYQDCLDNSDERDCKNCTNGGFRCVGEHALDQVLFSQCTLPGEQCDGSADCSDYSDEVGCKCPIGEFQCTDGLDKRNHDGCVPEAYRCDREDDCTDGSDENNCTYTCKNDDFMCKTGKLSRVPMFGYCIRAHEQCDGFSDCEDNSDEEDCHIECPAGKFKCNMGSVMWGDQEVPCLMEHYKCDRIAQCSDGSDEKDCDYQCPEGQFACEKDIVRVDPFYGFCLDNLMRCDGFVECRDGSDERNCSAPCAPDEFRCASSHDSLNGDRCIPAEFLCDRVVDCLDGSDEGEDCIYQCEGYHFPCTNGTVGPPLNRGYCLPASSRCDGHAHCADQSDELQCDADCPQDKPFACERGFNKFVAGEVCIRQAYVCDRENDCTDGSDEAHCNYTCPEGQRACTTGRVSRWPFQSYCIFEGEFCDKYTDCQDNSDENACQVESCRPGQFRCTDGIDVYHGTGCIEMEYRCDKHAQCHDGSDEVDCQYKCEHGEYACKEKAVRVSRYCIPVSLRCDGNVDCVGGDDEELCEVTCPSDQFRCVTGVDDSAGNVCIDEHLQCDRYEDCLDGSDEAGCTYQCDEAFFKCENGTVTDQIRGFCVSIHSKCDSMNDCRDGSDESDDTCDDRCQEGYVRCANSTTRLGPGRCVPRSFLCDRDADCNDGSDELNCNFECPDDEFACKTGKMSLWPHSGFCISHDQVCNGMFECEDHSDESHCNNTCPEHHVQCEDGMDLSDGDLCIHKFFQCDRIKDCSDNSDELNCDYSCASVNFAACRTGTITRYPYRGFCYPHFMICDGNVDCSDGSDEEDCLGCPVGQFQCQSGYSSWNNRTRCIPQEFKCNDVKDCDDGSDETLCNRTCAEGEFMCDSGILARWPYFTYCISQRDVCDFFSDCADNSDEKDCDDTSYRSVCSDAEMPCLSRTNITDTKEEDATGILPKGSLQWQCLPLTNRCDRYIDCHEGTDEAKCSYVCPEGQFKCRNGTVAAGRGFCIPQEEMCDGVHHCQDMSDESPLMCHGRDRDHDTVPQVY